ncbi:Scr1 family TA system antitoxin-like transcriptional regulator [Streptomyces hygroscopicus]|uniref:Scr1 family TA system antitoxin-like transcriptional regulator n=1 Tax=Streptomyces hygroscopicus TaxID=1912 RepID=UPI0022404CAD|nr:Scr1 family TA system antitoxin-like transcriptional regulator [Streptomyces hygroscopicus]
MDTIAGFRGTPDDVSEAVEVRMRRARVIYEGGHGFATLIEENVVNHRVGDEDVMAGRLGNLLAAMTLPSVSLGIISVAAAREGTMWPLEHFTVFDDSGIHVELLAAKVAVTAPGELYIYLRAFGRLTDLVVHGAEARALILRAIEALPPQPGMTKRSPHSPALSHAGGRLCFSWPRPARCSRSA